MKKYRQGGIEAFFEKRTGGRRGTVLAPEKLERAREFLDAGLSRRAVSEKLGVSADTFRKAVNDGRLKEAAEAVEASVADTKFEACMDVANGGVLCALPALLANGLPDGVNLFLGKVGGFYNLVQILIVLSFMGLCRIKTVDIFEMLQEYGTRELPDTERVVNPGLREMNGARNRLQNKLRYRRARFAELTIHPEEDDDAENYEKWLAKESELYEEIEQYEKQLETIKTEIKDIPKHVEMGQLEEKDRFLRLSSGGKRLTDTIRMIEYRAETAMVPLLTCETVDSAEARRLLRELFVSHADILPDIDGKILRVRVHNASRPVANRQIEKLLENLNETETKYPNTDLTLVY